MRIRASCVTCCGRMQRVIRTAVAQLAAVANNRYKVALVCTVLKAALYDAPLLMSELNTAAVVRKSSTHVAHA